MMHEYYSVVGIVYPEFVRTFLPLFETDNSARGYYIQFPARESGAECCNNLLLLVVSTIIQGRNILDVKASLVIMIFYKIKGRSSILKFFPSKKIELLLYYSGSNIIKESFLTLRVILYPFFITFATLCHRYDIFVFVDHDSLTQKI